MASDLNSIFKKYLSNLGKNEEVVVELTRNLRNWVVENGEIVKDRIETQIDEAAVRMGFAKTSELDNLNTRIAQLESRLKAETPKSSKKTSGTKVVKSKKVSSAKKSAAKKSLPAKKRVTK